MASTHFHLLLRERVEEEINKVKTELAEGSALDHAQYRFSVGQIFGLTMCLKLCEDIEGEFDERNNPASSG